MKCVCLEGGERGPIYCSRGRFPANAHMKGDQVPWQPLLLEMHLDRSQARFGRPHLAGPHPYPSLAGWHVGPDIFPCMHYAWRARLLCQMGPPCKWVMPNAIFCIVVRRLLRVFVLFHSCSSKMYNSRKQLWSEVNDTNMRVKCIAFFYY